MGEGSRQIERSIAPGEDKVLGLKGEKVQREVEGSGVHIQV